LELVELLLEPVEFEPVEFEPALFEPLLLVPVEFEPVLLEPVVFEPLLLEPLLLVPVEFEPVLLEPVEFDPVEFEPVLLEPVLLEPVVFEPLLLEPVVLLPALLSWLACWLLAAPGNPKLDASIVPLSSERLKLGPPSMALNTVTRAHPCGIAPTSAFIWTALTEFNCFEPTKAIVIHCPALTVTGLASA
jgi:hypothetical protein